jgi:hypothetical protein
MSCDRHHDAIAEAAAGGRAPGLATHLEGCEACRRELEARRRALALVDTELRALLASLPSPDLPARIHRAVAADRAAGWLRRARPALATAAALLLAFGVVAAWRATSRRPVSGSTPQARLAPTPWATGQPAGLPAGATEPAAQREGGRASRKGALEESAPGRAPVRREAVAPVEPPSRPEPEVLVPPGQEEALLRFAAELRGRTVTPDSVLAAEPSAPLNEPRPLYRVEIEVLTLGSPVVSGL